MIYRRFGYLQSRLLLDKQNELQDLEVMLEEMDNDDHKEDPGCLKRGDLDLEEPSLRKKLLGDIEGKFNEYGKFKTEYEKLPSALSRLICTKAKLVTSAKELTASSRPSDSSYRSFRNFFSNNAPLCQKDEPWIQCKEDMLTLRRGREHAWLDDMIEHILRAFNCRIIEVRCFDSANGDAMLTWGSTSSAPKRRNGKPVVKKYTTHVAV